MSIQDELAAHLSPSHESTPAQPGQKLPGGIGVVTKVVSGTQVFMTYNGAPNTPCNVLTDFTPSVGQTILVGVIGTQLWGIGPTTGARTAASVYRSAAETLGFNAFNEIFFDAAEFDDGNNWTLYNGSTRLHAFYTCPVAGRYQCNGNVEVSNNGEIIATIYKNGAEYKRGARVGPPNPAASLFDSGSVVGALVPCAAGDTLQLFCYLGDTVNRPLDAGTALVNYMTIHKIP